MQWFTYILLCSDGSYYAGHTEDLPNRLKAHNLGQGAIYTKHRCPVALVYSEPHSSKSEAITREKQIKRWSKAKKQALIDGRFDMLHTLVRRQGT
jgi:predicted GIY-YIG superfamily endonuclease